MVLRRATKILLLASRKAEPHKGGHVHLRTYVRMLPPQARGLAKHAAFEAWLPEIRGELACRMKLNPPSLAQALAEERTRVVHARCCEGPAHYLHPAWTHGRAKTCVAGPRAKLRCQGANGHVFPEALANRAVHGAEKHTIGAGPQLISRRPGEKLDLSLIHI